jgi:hypothetical protein
VGQFIGPQITVKQLNVNLGEIARATAFEVRRSLGIAPAMGID